MESTIEFSSLFRQQIVGSFESVASNCCEATIDKLSSLGAFFAEALFASLGTRIAFTLYGMFLQRSWWILLVVWILSLHWAAYAKAEEGFDGIESLNLGDIMGRPRISVQPRFLSLSDLSSELRSQEGYEQVKALFEMQEDHTAREVYLEVERFLSSAPSTELAEWVYFFKADLMFQVQESASNSRYQLALEDYQTAKRRFPLSEQGVRALYQMALLRLRMELYSETEAIFERVIKEYPDSSFMPHFYLLSGEQAFRSRKKETALNRFSEIIRQWPDERVAIDAVLRTAFLYFQDGNLNRAASVYENLDRYHGHVLRELELKENRGDRGLIVDRAVYAETLYLLGQYQKAAEIFQDLLNIFSEHIYTPLFMIRFADTYHKRERSSAAVALYRFVVQTYSDNILATSWAKVSLADLYFEEEPLEAVRYNERLYRDAFQSAEKAGYSKLGSLALVKLINFHLHQKSMPKAKARLMQHREVYGDDSRNSQWVYKAYINVIQREILDYYEQKNYLAALTTYISKEDAIADSFHDTGVLMKLSQAALEIGLQEMSKKILNRVIYLEDNEQDRQLALLKMIQIFLDQGEVRTASERLRRYNFAYPQSPFGHHYEKSWGDLYRRLENSEQAISHYEKALEEVEGDKDKTYEVRHIFFNMAELYQKQANPGKAVEYYERFIELYDDPVEKEIGDIPFTSQDEYLFKASHYRIADLYFEMKDYVQALQAYRRVSEKIQEEPFYSHAVYRMGESYLALDDREAALEAFSKLDGDTLWGGAASSYQESVEMEVKHDIRIFN